MASRKDTHVHLIDGIWVDPARARSHPEFRRDIGEQLEASTRRFEKVGWWKMAFLWLFVALLPTRLKRRFVYDVVR